MMAILDELSNGSSSSSPLRDHVYDVFLSFRGVDTRHSFTDHLLKALVDADIHTFWDDEDIQTGEDLKPEIDRAIKGSRASIIVLSKNYASSTWCLDELVLILELRRTSNHIVIPIFYHVDPTDVRKQESSFRGALAKHIQMMDVEVDVERKSQWVQKIEQWKKALTEVANLKGKDAYGRRETEFIEEIVAEIDSTLGVHSRRDLPLLIGMQYPINSISSWLKDGSSHTADILIISGMDGIGKTSLAKYVHGLHYRVFDRSTFIEDIGRRCAHQFNGLLDLQKQLFDDISKTSQVQVREVSIYTHKIENVLLRKKVFLVLDGVDSLDQLDALLGNKGFHPGSKVIITTKDVSLVQGYVLFNTMTQPKQTKYLLEGLHKTASLQLLCFHAFMCNFPKRGYEEVSKKLVHYCEGHPLALEILGKSLRNRDVAEWEDYIDGLKKETDSRIKKILQMSFDLLPSKNDKELFKHIACFFVGKDREFTETILKACGIRTLLGMRNLIDRCLIRIGPNNVLRMHNLLQELGKDVVDQESLKPWKRSRIWRHEESLSVLNKRKGKENLQGLILDMKMLEKERLQGPFELKKDAFSKLGNLMLLQLNHVQLKEFYDNFPKDLRWLCMHGFPLDHIPSDLYLQHLVALDMSYSNFQTLNLSYRDPQKVWKSQKLKESCSRYKRLLGSLKILNLSFSTQLSSLSGFFELPTLEKLILASCKSLIEVCESIGLCEELVLIDLSYCKKLTKLPQSISKLKKVRTLSVNGCSNITRSPIEMNNMESVELLNVNDISTSPQDASYTLVEDASRIPNSIFHFLPTSLVTLKLEDCKLVNESFPMDFSSLPNLMNLHLDDNLIVSLPQCVKSLGRLEVLGLADCCMMKTVKHPPRTLKYLDLMGCTSLQQLVFDPEMSPLRLEPLKYDIPRLSLEIDGMVKIQPLAHVEEEVLCCLGWKILDFAKQQEMIIETENGRIKHPVQMFYEFGIFSTYYSGKDIPNWISYRNKGSSISFTIPSSPKNLRGLNFCFAYTVPNARSSFLPDIVVSNITKKHTWMYYHCAWTIRVVEEGVWLSHWMFGENEMGDGDLVTITQQEEKSNSILTIRECGISFVYDDANMEDWLGYYKSWNHIIGGDLSGFQLTNGAYVLEYYRFWEDNVVVLSEKEANYKDKQVQFRAFSQRKRLLDVPQTHFSSHI